jgi:hypothetical protein
MRITPSQIATLRNVSERPGCITVATVGQDYASALEAAGYITIKGGRCSPTAAAAPYRGRTQEQLQAGTDETRMTLRARLGAR